MIRIKDLQKSYGEKPVLSHFSHDLPDNGIVCLTGASGRGKTTLLRILAGLETADGGSVTGLSGRKIAFVFQEDRLLPWITAQQNIRLAQPAGAKRPVGELLALAGLDSADGQKYPGQLSGGQRRRVAFLRGIAFLEGVKNGVLLLDEPFNGLDAEAAGKLCGMLRSLAPQTLVLLVSHQLAPLQALDVSFFSWISRFKRRRGQPLRLFAGTIFDRKTFFFLKTRPIYEIAMNLTFFLLRSVEKFDIMIYVENLVFANKNSK